MRFRRAPRRAIIDRITGLEELLNRRHRRSITIWGDDSDDVHRQIAEMRADGRLRAGDRVNIVRWQE
jgi:hypothetical protein